MTATSLAVMDTGARGALLLRHCLLAFAFVTLGECESVNVSECFFFFPTQETLTDTLLNSNKVFGAGQLDVAAKAVSASFDTLWYLKGSS